MNDRESLWSRVILSLYGSVVVSNSGVRLLGNNRRVSGWWREILSMGAGEDGSSFWGSLERKVGDGSDILFWEHMWAGDNSLRAAFPRLHALLCE